MLQSTLMATALSQAQSGQGQLLMYLDRRLEGERRRVCDSVQQTGFWFVDIPRTSSTSIRALLGERFGFPHGKRNTFGQVPRTPMSWLLVNHTPASVARIVIGEELWDRLTTFAVVRHPCTWARSLYLYTQRYETLGVPKETSFLRFLEIVEERVRVPLGNRMVYPINLKQSDYIFADEVPLVKHILHFEDRNAVEGFFRQSLGLADFDLGKTMASGADNGSVDTSGREKAIIRSLFHEDFERLGYPTGV